ncbi:MAG: glycerophosphoryl diester phosphodiesterase membrane domain-containing protein, partial [Candidatus Altarchaeum sp.]|nr:glycerophosphoryl diester phosphodiesterase membrane domain-containing protein [Candidatus Altarchaeum sp.]
LSVVLMFITFIVISSITYILPSVIVLNDNINVTDAVKKSLNFVKDNTKKFTFLILIVFVIQLLVSIPAFIISFANAMHPSFSLYVVTEIFSIVLNIIVAPYILSVYALTYAYSLMKEKESENKKDENEKDAVVLPEEIKSTQNLSEGLGGLSKA